MKKSVISSVAMSALALAAGAAAVRADEGPWEVRVRALYLDPADKSDAIPGLAPADAIHINSKWLPDVDVEYRVAPHWSSELVVTYPQAQTVTVGGTPVGTFKHLPPVLTAKYNFLPDSDFQPYVGVGINFTIISDVNLAVPGVGRLTLDSTSVGPAVQAGFDYRLGQGWYANADLKWAKLGSDVDLVGVGKVSSVHIDPILVGAGIGYRF